jgi:hypothetical protein
VTGDATSITSNSATLHGTSDLSIPGEWAFQYGTSSKFGSQTPATKVDAGVHAVSATIHNLSPNTTYHYRLLVVQASSAFPYYTFVAGAERTFRTNSTSAVGPRFGTVRLLSRRLRVRGRRAAVRLHCSGPHVARCAGRVSLSARGGRLKGCGSARFSASGGQNRTVRVRLNSGCLSRLARARGHRLGARLTIRFSTHQRTLRRNVTLFR